MADSTSQRTSLRPHSPRRITLAHYYNGIGGFQNQHDNDVQCPQRGISFQSQNDLDAHQIQHSLSSCNPCNLSFQDQEGVDLHNVEKHPDIGRSHCVLRFRSQGDVEEHVESIHQCACASCGRIRLSKQELNHHQEAAHPTLACTAHPVLSNPQSELNPPVEIEHLQPGPQDGQLQRQAFQQMLQAVNQIITAAYEATAGAREATEAANAVREVLARQQGGRVTRRLANAAREALIQQLEGARAEG